MLTQQEFDAEFITAAEIYQTFKVTRASLHYARERGAIPEGVYVGAMMVWRRNEIANPLSNWIANVHETKIRQTPKRYKVNGG